MSTMKESMWSNATAERGIVYQHKSILHKLTRCMCPGGNLTLCRCSWTLPVCFGHDPKVVDWVPCLPATARAAEQTAQLLSEIPLSRAADTAECPSHLPGTRL